MGTESSSFADRELRSTRIGHIYTPATRGPRVVSLLSSATEILYSLGGGALLTGRSHECDYPPQVRGLPQCTAPLIDVNADSRQIDAQVKNSARNALSIYKVFDDVLLALQPTHILTQTQCDVCAVSLKDVEKSVASQLTSNPAIVSLNPTCLTEIWTDFHRVGGALGLDSEACVVRMQSEMERFRPDGKFKRPSVACIEWVEPLMAAGNWTPELVEMAGGENLFGKAGEHSPWISWEQLIAADPEITVIAPCGFDLSRTEQELHWLRDRPEFQLLNAVYIVDGNSWFNRPGPRIVETLEILVEIIHGSGYRFEQVAWKRIQ